MWVETRCRLELDYAVDTPLILMLRPRSGASQWISSEHYEFSQTVPVHQYTDSYGNLCQKLTVPKGGFVVETGATVRTADRMDERPGAPFMDVNGLPDDLMQYLAPSRYCESDRLGSQTFGIVGEAAPGYDQVAAITDWIRQNIDYAPGSSAVPCSATEIIQAGFGVCRDHAQLGIALARSISIPSRFVVGYLLGLEPMDMHAWFEVYVGGRWYAFDPTQESLLGARVAVAYGRDSADVAIYHQFGPPAIYTDMKISIELA